MILLSPPEVFAHEDGRSTAIVPIQFGQTPHTVSLTVSSGPISTEIDPFLVMTLLPAMQAGMNIKVQGSVSARLLAALPELQTRYAQWFPRFRPITIEAEEVRRASVTTSDSLECRGVGSFFTAGVDSFYTASRHSSEIDTLIFAHGFDIPLGEKKLRADVQGNLEKAAARMGKRLVTIETDLRAFSDRFADWGYHYHGSALAALALLLAPQLERVYIPSSYAIDDLFPWGSHPDLDPHWSTEEVEIVHDGCEATRVQKVAEIADFEVAMEYLRVCFANGGGSYNCGRCEKCRRTLINLRVVGAEGRCRTFPRTLNMRRVAWEAMYSEKQKIFVEENLTALLATREDPVLEKALRDSLNNKYYRGLWKVLRRSWWRVKQLQWRSFDDRLMTKKNGT